MPKITRKQKIEKNPSGAGKSEYAKKIAKRRKLAKRLGMATSTPYPVLEAEVEK